MATVVNQALTIGALIGPSPTFAVMNLGPPSYAPVSLGAPMGAPAVAENQGLDGNYRFYDRGAKFGLPGFGDTIWAYQNDRIFGLGLGLHHSITGQDAALNFGLHTGLYHVDAGDGSRAYMVGMFVTAAGMGWVKVDLTTGGWSDGTASVVRPSYMSTCVAYKGRLYHAYGQHLTIFDPLNNIMSQVNMSGGMGTSNAGHVKLRIARGRLFLIGKGSDGVNSYLRICEFVFGGVAFHAQAPTHMDLSNDAFSHNTFSNDIWVSYEQNAAEGNGQGQRLFQQNVFSSVPGSALPALIDQSGAVDPLAIPGAGLDSRSSEIFWMGDNAHTAQAGAQASVLGYCYNFDSISGLHSITGHTGIDGFVPTWTFRIGGGAAPFPDGRYSRVGHANGTSESFHPLNAFPQIQDFAPFSDGTVARGILIRFRLFGVVSTFPQLRFLYNVGQDPVGGSIASLSVGDGIPIGPGMSLDGGGLFLNTGDPTGNGPTLFQIVWDLDADGVPDDEWMMIRGVGFLSGFDTIGLLFSGPAQQVFALADTSATGTGSPTETGGPVREVIAITSGNPPATGGPAREVLALTGGSPPSTGGPAREILALTGGSPASTGGPVREVLAESSITPDLIARIPNRPSFSPDGVIGWQTNAAEDGARPELNLVDATPMGQALTGSSALPLGPRAMLDIDGTIELGRVTLDCVGGSDLPVVDMAALGFTAVAVLAIKARAIDIQVVTSDPDVSLGTNAATFDDQAAAQTVAFVDPAGAQTRELVLVSPRIELGPTDVLRVQLDVAAVATAYSIEFVIYGVRL